MEWQPIETAPKDGTPCIIFIPGGTLPDGDVLADRVGEASFGWFTGSEWAWANDSCGCCWYSCVGTPTHWMPLPSAPKP